MSLELENGDCWPLALCWLFETEFTPQMRELSSEHNPTGCEAATDAWLKGRGVWRLRVKRDGESWPILLPMLDGGFATAIGPGDNTEGAEHCIVVQLRTGPDWMRTDPVFLPADEDLIDIETLVFFPKIIERAG
jgi:hypothetical protein